MTTIRKRHSVLVALTLRFVGFATIFLAGLVACPGLAVSAHEFLPRTVTNWLFFWPQVALAYYGFTMPASDVTRTFLDGGLNFAITGLFWAAVGLVVAWLLRHRRITVTLVATLPTSFIVAWLLLVVLGLMNIGVYLEGP